MPSRFNIAIIGAGPAGLTLGRFLHQANIQFTIFEGEADPHARTQGGTLDLHPDTGLLAVKKAGLWDAFKKYARYDGEAFILADKHFTKFFEEQGAAGEEDSQGRPEIDRERLREILLESLPAGSIHWGRHLKYVGEDLVLTFQDGSLESGFDLIVGADGAWSKIRPLLTPVEPFYTGIGGIQLEIADAWMRQPDLHRLVNKGSVFVFSDGKALQVQYNGSGTLKIMTWFRAPENWIQISGKNVKDVAQAKQLLASQFGDWSPQLKAFFERADGEFSIDRNLFMLPLNHTWRHRRGATLAGDSAHLMTPFAGEGVNVAMTDAMNLAEAIIKSTASNELDVNVKAFEEEMFVRAGKVQELTKNNMDDFFSMEPATVWVPKIASRNGLQAGGGVPFLNSEILPSEMKEKIAEMGFQRSSNLYEC